MPDNAKRMLTPKLRFPEFREENGWEEKTLIEVSDFVGERLPLKDIARSDYVSTENILPDFAGIGPPSSFPPTGTATHFRVNDVLISNIRPYLKKVWYATRGGGASNDVIVVRSKPCLIEGFLAVALKNDAFINYVMKGAKGVKMPRGDIGQMMGYPVALPLPAEQRKIADCLTSLDELIGDQGRKVEALKAHKKGLTQQLFPREGETLPRLRFPEFGDDQRFELKPIGGMAKVTTGAKDTRNKVDGGKYPFFVRSQNVERIDSFSHDGEAALTSGDGVGVGENYHYMKGKFNFHQRVYCIHDFDESANGEFFFHYFSTHFKKRVKQMSAKNSVDSVRMSMITEMPIWLPVVAEQQRIADCLCSLDARLAAESQILDTFKTQKKGLMQQ